MAAGVASADIVLAPLALQVAGLFGSFESGANLWAGEDAQVSLSGAHVRHGAKSMRVLFKAAGEEPYVYPDAAIRPRDWSAFEAFAVEVYNASSYLAELDMILYDTRGRDASRVAYLNPESWTTVRWPVASMTAFDTTKVAEMEIYVDAAGRADKVLYFDRMRLERPAAP